MSRELRETHRKAMQAHCPFKVFFGFDDVPGIRAALDSGEPFLFMDHAYFHRGYRHDANFRILYRAIHQTKVLDVPGNRFKLFKVRLHEWRDSSGHIVFIPAPKRIEELFGKWNEQTLAKIADVTDRPIKIKAKTDGSLADALHRSYGLVTHSSVAGVEAACLGFPVFGPETSPAYPVSAPIDQIESPVKTDRVAWVNSLAYSQFTTEEIKKGVAWSIIKELYKL